MIHIKAYTRYQRGHLTQVKSHLRFHAVPRPGLLIKNRNDSDEVFISFGNMPHQRGTLVKADGEVFITFGDRPRTNGFSIPADDAVSAKRPT